MNPRMMRALAVALATAACATHPPPRTFVQDWFIFFGVDSASIPPNGQAVLDSFASAYHRSRSSKVCVTTNANRGHDPVENVALSARRGASIQKYVVSRGIPEDRILVTNKGDTQPLVPGPNAVREPQNQRAEMIFC